MKSNAVYYLLIFVFGYLTNTFVTSFNSEEKITTPNQQSENQSALLHKNFITLNPVEQTKSPNIAITCKNEQDASGSLSNLQQTSPTLTDALKELTALREYKANNEIANYQDHLKEIGSNNNIAQTLADQFNKEAVDPSWSMESKSTLDNFINQKDHLNTLPNLSTECKSQQCKISILSTDPYHLSTIDESFGQFISDEKAFSNYTTIVDEKTNTTSIYIEKQPHNI